MYPFESVFGLKLTSFNPNQSGTFFQVSTLSYGTLFALKTRTFLSRFTLKLFFNNAAFPFSHK